MSFLRVFMTLSASTRNDTNQKFQRLAHKRVAVNEQCLLGDERREQEVCNGPIYRDGRCPDSCGVAATSGEASIK
jgi:hypothetical protein